jgi:hypothetical protein
VHITDAVVVAIGYEHFDVVHSWVKDAADATGFVQTGIECLIVGEGGLSITKPREDFIVEWVNYLYLMVVSIGHRYHIFVWYKANT